MIQDGFLSACPVCVARGTAIADRPTLRQDVEVGIGDVKFHLKFDATCSACGFRWHTQHQTPVVTDECIQKDMIQPPRKRRRRDRDPHNLINCAHANEAPNVCPCPSTCNCRIPGGMCQHKEHSYPDAARFDQR